MIRAIGAVAAMVALAVLWRLTRTHGAGPLLWRWFSGQPHHGRVYTDATWLRPATRVMHPTGRAHRWWHLPRLFRTAVRSGVTAAALGAAYGLLAARTDTMTALAGLAAGGLLAGSWRGVRAGRAYRVTRTVVWPLAASLGPLTGLPEPAARRAIALRPGYESVREGELARITFPDRFAASPDQRKAVVHLLASRLPVDFDTQWQTARYPQALTLLAVPECPVMVPIGDMIGAMAACKPGQVVIGLDRHGSVFHGSFTGDDPHWGFSVGSGRGKSTFLMLTAAQILRSEPESRITYIDPKMNSAEALAGVPGFTLANDPRNMGSWDSGTHTHSGGMWGAIDDFEQEMMRRLDARAADPTAEFPIRVLMLDETNQFSAQTAAHWRQVKSKEDPPAPQIWMKIASIMWMGRAVRMHVIMVGQRLDSQATGGIGLRDSLGFRGLAGYRKQQWDMLVGGPMPRSQKPKGRWIYSDGQAETWVQNLYASNADIRDYAMAGRRAGVPSGRDSSPAGRVSHEGTSAAGTGPAVAADWIRGLEAGASVLGLSTETFKKRRQRLMASGRSIAGEQMIGRQPVWTREDLIAFAAQDSVNAAQE